MAVTYAMAVKSGRMTATRDYHANGTLEILGGSTVLVAFALSASGGNIAADTWQLVVDESTVLALSGGTANLAQIKASDGTVGVSGLTVGRSDSDVIISNTSITIGQDVQFINATIQHSKG